MFLKIRKSPKRTEIIDAIMVLTKLLEVQDISKDTREKSEAKIRQLIEALDI